MATKSYPWIVCYDSTCGDKAGAFECLRCETLQYMALPIAIPVWVAAGKAFRELHRKCREKSEVKP